MDKVIQDDRLDIHMEPFPGQMVIFIDTLLDFAKQHSSMSIVDTEGDWQTLTFIYKGWKILYPTDAWNFEHDMAKVRKATVKKGIVKENGAMMQHIANVPTTLYQMVRAIFPDQKWNRKFIDKLIMRFPEMRAYEK